MKRLGLLLLTGSLLVGQIIIAQTKQLVQIDSKQTKEVINLKYNNKNQLVYFDEKGVATYKEFTFKYDKSTNILTECTMNQDRGELIINYKYTYNGNTVTEEATSSGKQIKEKKIVDILDIHIDNKGRLTKTVFEDGKPWEQFDYDDNDNLVSYAQNSALDNGKKIVVSKYNNDKSAFLSIESIPAWFWGWHINSMKWSSNFIGKNNPNEIATEDPRFGSDTIEITYEYDTDGYPVKQFYNGELVREFTYKITK
ncbi:hypothetical protein [Prevotella sp. 10(H)]|uniref:hypothetical protein n=1 Tax=Prevotella sp. 10(H) TaxID=1158294 RepID=UPI0004A6DA9D|nr:hypothetical protein [Prevotella sp. 10(H)]